MNYMKQVAEMLGIETGERFNVTDKIGGYAKRDYYYLADEGLMREGFTSSHRKVLADILAGKIKVIKKPWKPKLYDTFYFVEMDGKIESTEFLAGTLDYTMLYMGNCFRTYADAEAHRDEVMAKFKAVME